MIQKNKHGLNILYDKRLELILGIHVAYLKKHPEDSDALDWIEYQNIFYVNELIERIDIDKQSELCQYIKFAFASCDMPVSIAMGLTEDFEIDKSKMKEYQLEYGSLEEFVALVKKLAMEIKWDEFFLSHKEYYENFLNECSDFPQNFDLRDISDFYNIENRSYNYIPSILMNGGFGPSDKMGNLYYIRGIRYDEKLKKFIYDKEYLLECLFHEFSHPFINFLVDKYFDLFTNIEELYEEAVKNNLPNCYRKHEIFLYEYFVRANALILTLKYYPEAKIDSYIKEHGFVHIERLIDYTINSRKISQSYEEFFKTELVTFMNSINIKMSELSTPRSR